MSIACTNCGEAMRMTGASCGAPYDSYHEYGCRTCGRVVRHGWGPPRVLNNGLSLEERAAFQEVHRLRQARAEITESERKD